ncbi:MAG TPA: hypothetical protein VFN05_08790 [Actinomycetes bacterium]|nr:hypothetical protein [Actinomycetes bacterium]
MTTEPGAQPQPFEAPQMAASTEQQTQPGATPAALQVQILATEHWSLLATRSQTWNESFARAQMFLSALAASVIALALVAQATGFGNGFTAFALVLLPVVLFLGLTTYIRLVAVNHDETRWVLGLNRIRAAYLELAPELERWFITSHHDDERGAMVTAGWGTFPTLFGYVTTPAAVGVIDAVVAGVIVFLATRALGLQAPLAAALGVLVAVAWDLALTAYSRRAYRRWKDLYPPVSPTPETVH